MGLGLSISRSLVELHGGSIRARSVGPGLGSSFIVEFPLTPASVSGLGEGGDRGGSEIPRVEFAPSAAGLRVLLVDDHEPTLQALENLLKRRGFHVTTAGCMSDALEAAGRYDFDVLLCDIGLPDGDGCALMSRLADRHKLTGIAVSGYGTEADVDRSRRAGFLAHLVKPVQMESLDKVLATLTSRPDRR
jgi:CheY-like chemotaxis protein